jgi:23S rRNA pseudouridine2605 synthase
VIAESPAPAASAAVAEEAVKPKAKPRKKAAKAAVEASPAHELPVTESAIEAAEQVSEQAAVEAAHLSAPISADPIEEAAPAEKPAKKAAARKQAAKKAPVQATAAPADSDEESAQVPAAKLERLQKILARAGISSRRKAEELILGGQVQINGKIVTELGTKADPARDHVRVDGKLLQGAERIRYFMLNKPKGYVTTVSDPEGRPTVMQFFEHERERLYPVGRLDYLSEGLLLITNDGELANKLTKAASGVEKTYLVKVAGQPTEDMLDALRQGVVIEKGRPGTGSGRVRTAPAQIRQVRQGDNPWYEVIIIEGRNRELRKMFEEIGHHVEKIRRVGYGPLILDLEPGKLRELEPEEVQQLRLAAEGKLKTRRRRGPAPAQLPREAGKTVRFKKADGRPGYTKPEGAGTGSKPSFPKPAAARPSFPKADFPRPVAGGQGFSKPGFSKPSFSKSNFSKSSPDGPGRGRPGTGRPSSARSGFKSRPSEPPVTEYVLPPRKPQPEFDEAAEGGKGAFNPDYKPGFRTGGKPAARPFGQPGHGFDGPGSRGPGGPSGPGGAGKRFGSGPNRGSAPARPFRPAPAQDEQSFTPSEPRKPSRLGIEPIADRPLRPGRSTERPASRTGDRPSAGSKPFRAYPGGPRIDAGSGDRAENRPPRPPSNRSSTGGKPFRPRSDSPSSGPSSGPGRPRPARPSSGRPASGRSFEARPGASRPGPGRQSSEGRPFRPAGAGRPASAGRSDGPPRFTPRGDGPPARRPKPFAPREAGNTGGEFRRAKPFNAERGATGRSNAGRSSAGRSGAGKSFDAPKPQPGGSNSKPSGKLGPDGQPRVKVRARDSFTGKNKGRPKPKSQKDE